MVENGLHDKKYLFNSISKSFVAFAVPRFQACPSKQSIDALRVTDPVLLLVWEKANNKA
jgi:hypothetical protein